MTDSAQTIRDALDLLQEASLGWNEDNVYERAVAPGLAALDALTADLARYREALERGQAIYSRFEQARNDARSRAITQRTLDDWCYQTFGPDGVLTALDGVPADTTRTEQT